MAAIYWAGDSTVQYNSILTYPQCGIGQVMHLFVKPEVQVHNHAINGRSTKSFIDQGRLAEIYDNISEGDFLFVQFAHNDEKINDKERYTTPFGTFAENLERFANAARNKGAYPVFITPIERRCFEEDGTLGPGMHAEYVESAKQTAARLGVPCIDLYTRSRKILSELGPQKAAELHVNVQPGVYPKFPNGMDDHTHLCYHGAVLYASYIAEGLKELGGVYADILLELQSMEDVLRIMSENGEIVSKEDLYSSVIPSSMK